MASFIWMALQEDSGSSVVGSIFGMGFLVVCLGLAIFMVAAAWIVFTKAGEPGWACLIPIYNLIVMLRIAGKPWWWIFLMLIPLVNLVIAILVHISMAAAFGKGAGFGVGLVFLPIIFFPILAWGDAKYQGAPA